MEAIGIAFVVLVLIVGTAIATSGGGRLPAAGPTISYDTNYDVGSDPGQTMDVKFYTDGTGKKFLKRWRRDRRDGEDAWETTKIWTFRWEGRHQVIEGSEVLVYPSS